MMPAIFRLLGKLRRRNYSLSGEDEALPANGEKKKVIITDSPWIAVRRCFFHLIPIASSTAILTINLRGVFIGYDLSGAIKSETINLMLLQLAAKAHEILIVASLGMIILQTVRHELLFGDGLPLGLVGSGMSFSDFSFFFRAEFYGSLKYLASHGRKITKVGFIILLVLAGLIAALAGPSSAVLLVPRSQSWPSAATNIYLAGAAEDLWPSDLSGDMPQLSRLCTTENSTVLAFCPAGGFTSLQDHWSRMNSSTFFTQNIPPYARLLSGSFFYWPVASPKGLIPPLYALGNARESAAVQYKTTLVQPLAAASAVLQKAANDWWKAMKNQKGRGREGLDALIDDRQVRAQTQSAIATVRCAPAQNLSLTNRTIVFPTIPFGSITWVQLPGRFGPASIGGVFQSSWATDNSSRVVIGCTAQTGWVPTDVRTDSYSFWSGWYPWNITWGDRTPRYVEAPHDDSLSATNGRIALGEKWLNLLTPFAPVKDTLATDWQQSTIEDILVHAGLDQKGGGREDTSRLSWWTETDLPEQSSISFLEAIICSVLVDGISRTGSYHIFETQGTPPQWQLKSYETLPNFSHRILSGRQAFKAPDESEDLFSVVPMTMNITGYVLRRSLSAYLAMAVLLTHGVMALLHTFWILFDKHTSRTWSSATELIALAQNSTPAFSALANTAAGIERASTFARIAKIRVRSQPGSTQRDHVELVIEDGSRPHGTRGSRKLSVRRSLNPHSDPWPALLSSSNNEPNGTRRARGSATWPNDPRKLSVHHDDTELDGRSESTERLIPRVQLADEEKGDVVRVNRSYG